MADQAEIDMLSEAVGRFVRTNYGPEERRRRLRGGASTDLYRSGLADNGWLGAGFSEEAGGFGGGPAEIAAIAHELGRGLAMEPYLPNVVTGRLVSRLGSEPQADLVRAMIAGETKLALAFAEPQSRYDLADCLASAKASPAGYTLNARKIVVTGGDEADQFVVAARIAGGQREPDGLALFIVPRAASGVEVSSYRLLDERGACDLVLNGVELGREALLGPAGAGFEALEQAIDEAAAFLCAEAVGSMAAALQLTLDYVKVRVQFGKPIGSNQALQHRLVDMHIRIREAEALTRAAIEALEGDAHARALAVSAAKIHVGQTARLVSQEMVQMHGGIGTTDEAVASHFFKRLTTFGLLFGDVDFHVARFGRLIDEPTAMSTAFQPAQSSAA